MHIYGLDEDWIYRKATINVDQCTESTMLPWPMTRRQTKIKKRCFLYTIGWAGKMECWCPQTDERENYNYAKEKYGCEITRYWVLRDEVVSGSVIELDDGMYART